VVYYSCRDGHVKRVEGIVWLIIKEDFYGLAAVVLRIGTGSRKRGIETSGSIKCGEFLYYLRTG
jgi:hypothetical protein